LAEGFEGRGLSAGDLDEVRQELEATQGKLASVEAANNALIQERRQLARGMKLYERAVAKLTEENEALSQSKERLIEENKALNQSREELIEENDALKEATEELIAVTAERDEARDDLERTKEALEAVTAEANELKRELAAYRSQASPTSQTVLDLNAECERVKEELEITKQQLVDAQALRQRAIEELSNGRAQLDAGNAEENDAAKLKQQLEAVQRNIPLLTDRCFKLKRERDEARDAANHSQGLADFADQQFRDKVKEYDALEREMQSLRREFEGKGLSYDAEIKRREEELNSMRDHLEGANRDLSETRDKLAQTKRDLEAAMEKVKSLDAAPAQRHADGASSQ
jgi:chromosome segregation ATPase